MKLILQVFLIVPISIVFTACDQSSSTEKKEGKEREVIYAYDTPPVEENRKPLGESEIAVHEGLEDQESVLDSQVFQKALAPYGSWYETEEYGSVWQPEAGRDTHWRPYSRGQWVGSDQGWTWVSTEPFGWATYHYGRWARLQTRGWIWVPGTEWAPNWCTWRSSDDYIGWAPLPPETLAYPFCEWDSRVEEQYGITPACFNFVSTNHFDCDINSYFFPIAQNLICFNTTTNITQIRFRDEQFFCGGPEYRGLSERLGRRIPYCRIDRSRKFSERQRIPDLQSKIKGDRLIVAAPKIRSTRPIKSSRSLGKAEIERSKTVNPQVIEAYRVMRQRASGADQSTAIARRSEKPAYHATIERTVSRERQAPAEPRERQTKADSERQRSQETAAIKQREEMNRRQQQERIARQQNEEVQQRRVRDQAEEREEVQRRERQNTQRRQQAEEQRNRVAEQREQREEMQRRQQQEAQRRQRAEEEAEEEEEQRQRVAEQRKQREEMQRRQQEEAQRKQREEQQRKRVEEQRKQREEMQRRQQEEAQRKQREEQQRQRVEEQRKQREEAQRRQQEEAQRKQREERQRKQREEAQRRQQEEAQRQRVEEQRKQREESQRRQREDSQRKQREETQRQRRGK